MIVNEIKVTNNRTQNSAVSRLLSAVFSVYDDQRKKSGEFFLEKAAF